MVSLGHVFVLAYLILKGTQDQVLCEGSRIMLWAM